MNELSPARRADHTLAIGEVVSVRGSEITARLPAPKAIDDMRATVGSYVAIKAPWGSLIGMITDVSADEADRSAGPRGAICRIDLVGQIARNESGPPKFQRGARQYPYIGDVVELLPPETLRLIYAPAEQRTVAIGRLTQNPSIPVAIDTENLVAKHFAVLGTTGVGKSSGLAAIVDQISAAKPELRVFILDIHNEYSRCFGGRANSVGGDSFKLPFWIFNFEEFCDVLYGGRPPVAEETDILAELIPIAKSAYLNYKAADRPGLKRRDPKMTGFTVDTPVPYLLQDLLSLIDERMGKLENRASRMTHHRLMQRIESIKCDPRYAFMFESANVGGDTMAALLGHLFQLGPGGRNITLFRLASLPSEVVDAVVCVILRLAFDLGVWSDGAFPLLCICEEAHRFAAADHTIGFAPTRRALSRIAKEGRKYQVCLGLVTQRPAELDSTIISQCSTLFAMRMANEQDQALLRFAVSDAASSLSACVPSLATGEAVGFGEGMLLPARFFFQEIPRERLPRSEIALQTSTQEEASSEEIIRAAVEKWRRAKTNTSPARETPPMAGADPIPADGRQQPPAGPINTPSEMRDALNQSLLEQARQRILRR